METLKCLHAERLLVEYGLFGTGAGVATQLGGVAKHFFYLTALHVCDLVLTRHQLGFGSSYRGFPCARVGLTVCRGGIAVEFRPAPGSSGCVLEETVAVLMVLI